MARHARIPLLKFPYILPCYIPAPLPDKLHLLQRGHCRLSPHVSACHHQGARKQQG